MTYIACASHEINCCSLPGSNPHLLWLRVFLIYAPLCSGSESRVCCCGGFSFTCTWIPYLFMQVGFLACFQFQGGPNVRVFFTQFSDPPKNTWGTCPTDLPKTGSHIRYRQGLSMLVESYRNDYHKVRSRICINSGHTGAYCTHTPSKIPT